MADAMCGPSNALQQFGKQSSRDRTLQQDRLTLRHSQSQGFRSADRNAGMLDPQFEAFQAGLPPSELPQFNPAPFHPQPIFAGSSQAPSWANDFQRLEISPPSRIQHQGFAQGSPVSSGWAQGFQQHISQMAPRAQSSSPSPLAFQQRARYGLGNFQGNFAQPAYAPSVQSTNGKEAVYDDFDQAAFARAFDEAQHEIMTESEQQDTAMQEAFDESMHEDLGAGVKGVPQHELFQGRSVEPISFAQQEPVLNEFANDILTEQPVQEIAQDIAQDGLDIQEDDDALAATAQELLEKVEHNQTDKFKNSQFLGLMRKLRDREIKVEGDKMVDIASASSASDPLNADTSLPRFDNSEQRPFPLATPAGRQAGIVDTQPHDHGIPAHEQDVDAGRVQPSQRADGQDVVELLDESGPLADEIASDPALDSIETPPPASPAFEGFGKFQNIMF